jgi:phage host-nuclease inhibitor protein Gam
LKAVKKFKNSNHALTNKEVRELGRDIASLIHEYRDELYDNGKIATFRMILLQILRSLHKIEKLLATKN